MGIDVGEAGQSGYHLGDEVIGRSYIANVSIRELMTAKKSSGRSPKKRSTKKSARKSAKRAAAKRSSFRSPASSTGALSPYGRDVLQAFSAGVQEAYANMARAGVKAAVIVDGKLIHAIPVKRQGKFVVSEGADEYAPSRGHR